jgi:WD40 repeat protein
VSRSVNEQYLASGGDDGMVRLFKYPCYQESAGNLEFCGHSSHVTKVRFSPNDELLISTGGKDMTVLVWETDWGKPSAEPIVEDEESEELELKEDHQGNLNSGNNNNDDDDAFD